MAELRRRRIFFSPAPKLSPEAERRGRQLGLTGVVGIFLCVATQIALSRVAAAPLRVSGAAMAVYFSTVGALAGIVLHSARHSVAGLYAGIAAGVASMPFTWTAASLYFGEGLPALAVSALGAAAAYAVFGAVFAAADNLDAKHLKQGASAGLIWIGLTWLWLLVLWVPFFVVLVVAAMMMGVSRNPIFSIVLIPVAILDGLASLYVYYRTTRRFFFELGKKGIFWADVAAVQTVPVKRPGVGDAKNDSGPQPEEPPREPGM